MKTLPILLVLLSSCVAWGQNTLPSPQTIKEIAKWIHPQEDGTMMYEYNVWRFPPCDSFDLKAFERGLDSTLARGRMAFMDSLIVWWDQYARECYNDSSYGQVQCSHPEYLIVCYGWNHGYPNFPGFIEFLRRKK